MVQGVGGSGMPYQPQNSGMNRAVEQVVNETLQWLETQFGSPQYEGQMQDIRNKIAALEKDPSLSTATKNALTNLSKAIDTMNSQYEEIQQIQKELSSDPPPANAQFLEAELTSLEGQVHARPNAVSLAAMGVDQSMMQK